MIVDAIGAMIADLEATGRAARCGFLTCMRHAHLRGAPWHPETTGFAARGGYVECLRFAHENGAIWASYTTALAARAGSLACLAYAHEHGARWEDATTLECILSMSLDCLRFATEHGAPRHHDTVHMAVKLLGTFPDSYRGLECLGFAIDRRYPYDPCTITRLGTTARETVLSVLSLLRKVRLMQRTWRAHRDRQIGQRRAAVGIIEDAYLAWACRPGDGCMFQRTMVASRLRSVSAS